MLFCSFSPFFECIPVKLPELLEIIRKNLNEAMISQTQELNHLNKDNTEIFVRSGCGGVEDKIMEKRGRSSEAPIYFFFV
jgi:hypothetical protein